MNSTELKTVTIVVKDPTTNEEKVIEKQVPVHLLSEIEKEIEKNLEKAIPQDVIPKEKVLNAIQNLNIPAEAKVILSKVLDITITIGNKVISIGKKILEIMLYMISEYPSASVGLVVGMVIGLSFNLIPLLGHFVSSIVTPLLAALGFGIGFLSDIKDKTMEKRIEENIIKHIGYLKKIE